MTGLQKKIDVVEGEKPAMFIGAVSFCWKRPNGERLTYDEQSEQKAKKLNMEAFEWTSNTI